MTVVFTVLAPASHANAAPTPEEVRRQLDQAWEQLEPTIEQYNGVRVQLAEDREKAAVLQGQIDPLRTQLDTANARIGALAAKAYMGGRFATLNAMLAGDSPGAAVERLGLLNVLARDQRTNISTAAALHDKYAAEKRELDALIAKLAAQEADLVAKKNEIEAKIEELQRLQRTFNTSTGTNTTALRTGQCPAEAGSGPGAVAAAKACSLIGKPYVWGAAGPNGFDCSGLTLTAWAAAGVKLRHYTKWQWQDTRAISRAELRLGDLVFYYSDLHHMGIYVGGGIMVHAPHSGDHVRMAPIDRGMPIAGFRRPG